MWDPFCLFRPYSVYLDFPYTTRHTWYQVYIPFEVCIVACRRLFELGESLSPVAPLVFVLAALL